ncbi:hypothetical protein SALBM311S_11966 [Streptomyces alboniger]
MLYAQCSSLSETSSSIRVTPRACTALSWVTSTVRAFIGPPSEDATLSDAGLAVMSYLM